MTETMNAVDVRMAGTSDEGRRPESASYLLFGLSVKSDFTLPLAPLSRGDNGDPDLSLIRGPSGAAGPEPHDEIVTELRCHCAIHRGGVYTRVYRSGRGHWTVNPGVARCLLSTDARRAEVWCEPDVDEQTIGLFLAGQIGVMALRRRGEVVLHASAVATEFGAIGFLGPKGHGKSTMAAGFLQRGATLLTDDILPIRLVDDAVLGIPGPPLMKLWRQALAGSLHIYEDLPPVAAFPDKLLLDLGDRYPRAKNPVPLRALYILERYDPISAGTTEVAIRAVTGRAALTALVAQTSWNALLRPDEMARLLPLYARLLERVPLHTLRYPNGFAHQQMVCDRLISILAEGR